MKCGESTFVWQSQSWPHWRFELRALAHQIEDVSRAQGLLLGRLADAAGNPPAKPVQ
jgi:hypothetical protein